MGSRLLPPRTIPLFLATALLVTACASEPGEVPTSLRGLPIVNGTASASGFLPAVGALVVGFGFSYQAFCTGSLVGDTLVLTAAHCIADLPSGIKVYFFVGNNTKSMGASDQVIAATSAKTHPSYTGQDTPGTLTDFYDVAVVKLAKAPAGISPIKMVKPSQSSAVYEVGQSVLAMGFGQTDPGDSNSAGTKFQGTTSIYQVGDSEYWIYSPGGAQKCMGDSGGPTLVNAGSAAAPEYRVIGVASRAGENCTYGAIDTRVDAYLSWIHQQGTIPCDSGLGSACPPPAALGETCKTGSDCGSSLCITYNGALACSQSCSPAKGDCPSGYTCVTTASGSPGCVKSSSVPASKKELGEACAADSDCESGLCQAFEEESLCSAACSSPEDCGSDPETLTCRAVDDGTTLCGPPAGGASTGGCSSATGAAPARGTGSRGLLLLALLAVAGRRRAAGAHLRRVSPSAPPAV